MSTGWAYPARHRGDRAFRLYAAGAAVFEREDAHPPHLRHYVKFEGEDDDRREVARSTVVILGELVAPGEIQGRRMADDDCLPWLHANTAEDTPMRGLRKCGSFGRVRVTPDAILEPLRRQFDTAEAHP